MTRNKSFKRRVRARMTKTGESYTAALQHLRPASTGEGVPTTKQIRLAVAQTTLREDPRNSTHLRESGLELRHLMRQASNAGARIVHFPEGAFCFPHKRIMSIAGPDRIGPSDWSLVDWEVLHEELAATAALARDLKIWIALGSLHRLTSPHRPYNSLYVISDYGKVETRYDERMLSHTKVSFMYTPGSVPVMFEVDGIRFGCSLGMECHFPEIFTEYERFDVDCVLFSTTGGASSDGIFAVEVQGHAAANTYWISFSVPTQHSKLSPSGIVAPNGEWMARCSQTGAPEIAVTDIEASPNNIARSWKRTARSRLNNPHLVDNDQRSNNRRSF
jgi:predicted amidohydrolase